MSRSTPTERRPRAWAALVAALASLLVLPSTASELQRFEAVEPVWRRLRQRALAAL